LRGEGGVKEENMERYLNIRMIIRLEILREVGNEELVGSLFIFHDNLNEN
jgi:hypothetical protein